MLKQSRQNKAQSLVEYSLVLGIITVVIFAMTPMLRRSSQGMIKFVADQVGYQNQADQNFNDTSTGHLLESYVSTRVRADKETQESGGVTSYVYRDRTETDSNAVSNLGFREVNR